MDMTDADRVQPEQPSTERGDTPCVGRDSNACETGSAEPAETSAAKVTVPSVPSESVAVPMARNPSAAFQKTNNGNEIQVAQPPSCGNTEGDPFTLFPPSSAPTSSPASVRVPEIDDASPVRRSFTRPTLPLNPNKTSPSLLPAVLPPANQPALAAESVSAPAPKTNAQQVPFVQKRTAANPYKNPPSKRKRVARKLPTHERIQRKRTRKKSNGKDTKEGNGSTSNQGATRALAMASIPPPPIYGVDFGKSGEQGPSPTIPADASAAAVLANLKEMSPANTTSGSKRDNPAMNSSETATEASSPPPVAGVQNQDLLDAETAALSSAPQIAAAAATVPPIPNPYHPAPPPTEKKPESQSKSSLLYASSSGATVLPAAAPQSKRKRKRPEKNPLPDASLAAPVAGVESLGVNSTTLAVPQPAATSSTDTNSAFTAPTPPDTTLEPTQPTLTREVTLQGPVVQTIETADMQEQPKVSTRETGDAESRQESSSAGAPQGSGDLAPQSPAPEEQQNRTPRSTESPSFLEGSSTPQSISLTSLGSPVRDPPPPPPVVPTHLQLPDGMVEVISFEEYMRRKRENKKQKPQKQTGKKKSVSRTQLEESSQKGKNVISQSAAENSSLSETIASYVPPEGKKGRKLSEKNPAAPHSPQATQIPSAGAGSESAVSTPPEPVAVFESAAAAFVPTQSDVTPCSNIEESRTPENELETSSRPPAKSSRLSTDAVSELAVENSCSPEPTASDVAPDPNAKQGGPSENNAEPSSSSKTSSEPGTGALLESAVDPGLQESVTVSSSPAVASNTSQSGLLEVNLTPDPCPPGPSTASDVAPDLNAQQGGPSEDNAKASSSRRTSPEPGTGALLESAVAAPGLQESVTVSSSPAVASNPSQSGMSEKNLTPDAEEGRPQGPVCYRPGTDAVSESVAEDLTSRSKRKRRRSQTKESSPDSQTKAPSLKFSSGVASPASAPASSAPKRRGRLRKSPAKEGEESTPAHVAMTIDDVVKQRGRLCKDQSIRVLEKSGFKSESEEGDKPLKRQLLRPRKTAIESDETVVGMASVLKTKGGRQSKESFPKDIQSDVSGTAKKTRNYSATPKKKVGRPKKRAVGEAFAELEKGTSLPESPKRRGRPPKNPIKVTEVATKSKPLDGDQRKKASRRRREQPAPLASKKTGDETDEHSQTRRGRPPKNLALKSGVSTGVDGEPLQKKRGRIREKTAVSEECAEEGDGAPERNRRRRRKNSLPGVAEEGSTNDTGSIASKKGRPPKVRRPSCDGEASSSKMSQDFDDNTAHDQSDSRRIERPSVCDLFNGVVDLNHPACRSSEPQMFLHRPRREIESVGCHPSVPMRSVSVQTLAAVVAKIPRDISLVSQTSYAASPKFDSMRTQCDGTTDELRRIGGDKTYGGGTETDTATHSEQAPQFSENTPVSRDRGVSQRMDLRDTIIGEVHIPAGERLDGSNRDGILKKRLGDSYAGTSISLLSKTDSLSVQRKNDGGGFPERGFGDTPELLSANVDEKSGPFPTTAPKEVLFSTESCPGENAASNRSAETELRIMMSEEKKSTIRKVELEFGGTQIDPKRNRLLLAQTARNQKNVHREPKARQPQLSLESISDQVNPHSSAAIKSTTDKESKERALEAQAFGDEIVHQGTSDGKKVSPPELQASTEDKGPGIGEFSKLRLSASSTKDLFLGVPDEDLDGGWPPGWKKRVVERLTGDAPGHCFTFWYSPKLNKRFRKLVKVRQFLAALKENDGDEQKAWEAIN